MATPSFDALDLCILLNHRVFHAAGDVLKQRFKLMCTGWHDDGYEDPTNITEVNEFGEEMKMISSSLYYKFLLRKNGISVPVAEGGQCAMLFPLPCCFIARPSAFA